MNEILSVGLILMAALLAGHLAQLARIPEVTGYLLVGLLIGPATLDLISHDDLAALGFLSEVALGLILFNIGSLFEYTAIRHLAASVARVTLWEATGAFVLVGLALLIAGLPWPVALLLAAVAMETAPATTLMVLQEYDAHGPMTDRLLPMVAMNNMYVLVTFGLVSAVLTFALQADGSLLAGAYRAVHALAWSVAGSAALGVLLGLGMDLWAARARERGEAMILAVGVVLIAVGLARWLGLSPLICTLVVGATVANASARSERLVRAMGNAGPPLFAAFFVLAGAELVPSRLLALGATGALYALARTVGKVGGARLGMRGQPVQPVVREQLGFCLLSSSSLAVGLTLQVREAFPQYAAATSGVVLAAVLIFEIVGPLLTRRALVRTGEANVRPSALVAPAEVS